MSDAMDKLVGNRILISAVGVVLGIVLVVAQSAALDFIVQVVGGVALVAAVVFVGTYLYGGRIESVKLVLAVLFAIVGVLFLAAPWLIVDVLPFIVGIVLMVAGVVNLGQAFNLSRMGDPYWKQMLVAGVIMLVLGVLIALHPGVLADFITVIAGIALIVGSVVQLYVLIKAKHDGVFLGLSPR